MRDMDMGIDSRRVFAGQALLPANKLIYGESAELFASAIRAYFEPAESYSLIDLGSASGEFAENVIAKLNGYKFFVTAVDLNTKSLDKNRIAQNKIAADLSDIPVESKSFDIAIMRYVFAWNPLGLHEAIAREAARATKGIAIVQHCGPDDKEKDEWRAAIDKLFSDESLPQLNRTDYFYDSAEELESIFQSLNIDFKRIQSRKIEGFADIFAERYALSEAEIAKAREITGRYDHIMQYAWILDFRHN